MEEQKQITRWYSFGHGHEHKFKEITLDVNILVEITDVNPRKVMVELFGDEWAFEYRELPQMKYFPRGIMYI